MFKLRKNKIEPSFIIFAFVTFSLIALTALIFLFIFNSKSQPKVDREDVYQVLIQEDQDEQKKDQQINVSKEYQIYMADLMASVSNFEAGQQEFTVWLENAFLSVRVPIEKLDIHLQVLLELKQEFKTSEYQDLKEKSVELISGILNNQ